MDYKFELPRIIHTGIVAVAEWYNFRIPTLGVVLDEPPKNVAHPEEAT